MNSRELPSTQERLALEKQAERDDVTRSVRRAQGVIAARNYTGEDWRDEALCSTVDPNLFDTSVVTKAQIENSQKLCNSCNVAESCLDYIVKRPGDEADMLWGGFTPAELKLARRRKMSFGVLLRLQDKRRL